MALSKEEQARYESNKARLLELEAEQSRLRAAGMPKRHPEYELLQEERDKQFEVTFGYPVGCMCHGLVHGANPQCPAVSQFPPKKAWE